MSQPIYDMIIIGAGLSGIGAAYRFRKKFPSDNLAVLEMRGAIGGTWDLFQYPGVRSDSDMLTLGYDFHPWVGDKMLADGGSIRDYIQSVADEYDITNCIQFNSKVVEMDFSTETDLWVLTVTDQKTGETRQLQARFVISSTGYYKYDEGYTPSFDGREDFTGEILHPQHWPKGFEYKDKKIIVIGSGATAVTLVPQLAQKAAHVTMLQRSPTFIASMPSQDKIGNFLRAIFPARLAFKLARGKNLILSRYFYKKARKKPEKVRQWFLEQIRKELGPDYPVETHFNPSYNPWDQRVCLVPDNDLFVAIKEKRASVVTNHIDRFTPNGLLLKSGEELQADVIITATGLNVVFNGGAKFKVDGKDIHTADRYGYKGTMFSDIPNMISIFGYVNASWTLRSDLISQYAVRLVEYMKEKGYTRATPIAPEGMGRHPWLDFQAGYLLRDFDKLPSQGDYHPWLNRQDYKLDRQIFLKEPVADGVMRFSAVKPVN